GQGMNSEKMKPLQGGAVSKLEQESKPSLALRRNVFPRDSPGGDRRTHFSRCRRLVGRCASPVDTAREARFEGNLIDVGAQQDRIRAGELRYAAIRGDRVVADRDDAGGGANREGGYVLRRAKTT